MAIIENSKVTNSSKTLRPSTDYANTYNVSSVNINRQLVSLLVLINLSE